MHRFVILTWSTVRRDCQVCHRFGMPRHRSAQWSLGTGHQLLQGLLLVIAVDQQHLLDPVLLEAHVAELCPEAQEFPCLRKGRQRAQWELGEAWPPTCGTPCLVPSVSTPRTLWPPQARWPCSWAAPAFSLDFWGDMGSDLPFCTKEGGPSLATGSVLVLLPSSSSLLTV